jgi:hypothetical protein
VFSQYPDPKKPPPKGVIAAVALKRIRSHVMLSRNQSMCELADYSAYSDLRNSIVHSTGARNSADLAELCQRATKIIELLQLAKKYNVV